MKKQDIGRDIHSPDEPVDCTAQGRMNEREDQTDWEYLATMTEAEAYRNALADADSQPMTPVQLAQMRRAPNPRVIRDRLRMTQTEFARTFQISVGTLRDWEQGLHLPDSAGTAYLRVIEQIPTAVMQALHRSESSHLEQVNVELWSTSNVATSPESMRSSSAIKAKNSREPDSR
jgi:putative transcriptional regulator